MFAHSTIVQMHQVSKRFGDLVALEDVSVELNSGEIHAIIGENGAGKSTLMRILGGHFAADAGTLVINGATIEIKRAHQGYRASVGFVEQEGGLIDEMTGAENLILAERGGFWSDTPSASKRLRLLAETFDTEIATDVPVVSLAMGQRQRLEILIVLALGARILILDEPTASLSVDDAKALGGIMREFTRTGGAIFYISHKLNEVRDVADRISVMRRGKLVSTYAARNTTVTALAADMVGDVVRSRSSSGSIAEAAPTDLIKVALGARDEIAFEGPKVEVCRLSGVSAPARYKSEAGLSDVNLTVFSGEIVGIAGVVGSGQTTLAEVMAGLVQLTSGYIRQKNNGSVAYIPENRHRDALALSLSIQDNLLVHLQSRPEFLRGLWFRHANVRRHVDGILNRFRIRGAKAETLVRMLSGGNQQKVVVGRELDKTPSLVVAHNPFRGLDVRAIQDVRDSMFDACRAGSGVVMISSDLDELVQSCHRIVVLFSGRVVGEVDLHKDGLHALGGMMGGIEYDRVG
ncbi:ABC transporter ATP-binding protein [Bradyrhizobium canariense]|uniref:Nucleoside ABC transporter ATP-binding protein n=1 Tax=Bradyrhizobium canariense TaxID=255045 RepID=A0A1H1YQW5_9BRAD|nr:ATP-binding cassette domain-containing protein [Bradyrhizobium canariense]SDT23824.1 nucleoside ABC transporter ATP-binding protein [Bradyrhizobium canariense]